MPRTKCRRCGRGSDGGFCSEKCRLAFNEARRLRRVDRKARGLCSQCGKKAVRGKTLCKEHARRWAESNKRSWDRIKLAAFAGYGGPVCNCCGTTVLAFLTIDHTEGGGRQHRLKNRLLGSQLYRWLIRNNFPPGFRVLCHNCNSGRHVNGGVCPCDGVNHQRAA